MLPRQRKLKRIPQVEQAPRNDDIVVQSHVETDLRGEESICEWFTSWIFNIYTASTWDIQYDTVCADLYIVHSGKNIFQGQKYKHACVHLCEYMGVCVCVCMWSVSEIDWN